ncbi:Stk1 family PASTA domain-containing Ser/Thr kinase [Sporosarcina sp. ANT_H38]|uniref:Stk1 family PASTA domain-containing Ser/Thr kinase n=1 Tax=Sporosarcina sp. ANT_H38 TaxID=2597358 RepID=UPI0011F24089|nr:Stk1 family PASTA domain-containing Ser/Thr kinase [Sporosarcina sp. ANT_H38]KAA0966554.1 Stk1 family PASTA domain-containing Ser/Thr kinase [Sporosarcina sp. ANT_H38]
MIGSRIGGRYEIVRNIGDGGMSKVYLAHDVILDRDVAIKVLNYDFANEEALKRRFKREALSATSLTHPHIVDIFDVGEEDELHYLVMEYIEGQTLKKFIQDNGALTPEQALPIMQQIVSAIANAHHNGIVHRDVKPQNILMDSDGNVKITDFGIAMALSATAHTKTNSVIGTVHYLSPEQARGGMATKKSDIYSLGIVLYELLSGVLPFTADTAVAIALKHLQEETPSVRTIFPSIPQSVENVILKATMKDATYRYDSADEMYDDLLTVLSAERANEKKFAILFDDDRTRAIPIVSEPKKFDSVEDTKKIEPVKLEQPTPLPKKRKKWPFIVGGIAGVIILLLLILGMLGPKKAIIPNVSGMQEVEAMNRLLEEGFEVIEKKEESSDEFKKGEVIQTIPEAEKKRDVDSVITLYISTGEETMELANYVGRNAEITIASLADKGFKSIDDPIEEFSDEPKGTIIGQDPEAGEVIPSETELQFTVSKGPDLQNLDSLLGYDEKQLGDYEKSSGFKIDIVREVYSSTVPKGLVISQTPDGNTAIKKGGKVEVVLSKGPEQKPDKSIFRTVTIEYVPEVVEPVPNEEIGDGDEEEQVEGEEEDIEDVQEPAPVPQIIRIYIQDKNNKMTKVFEEFSITETTKKQISLNLEEGQNGAYKITRDNKTILADVVNYNETK